LYHQQTLATIKRSILEQALERTGGNKKAAAEMLGLKQTTPCAKVRNMEALAACGSDRSSFQPSAFSFRHGPRCRAVADV
jgi:hypothetical protein